MPYNHLILYCPLLLLPSIFPSIRVFFPMSQLFASSGQSIGVSASASVLQMYIQDWFPLGLIAWISLSRVTLTPQFKSITSSAFSMVQLSHPQMTTGKTIALTTWTFVGNRLVIAFLPRSKHLLISWLQSPSAVILEPPKIKSDTVSTVSPFICQEVMGPDAMFLVFWMLSFKPALSLSSFTFIKRLFSSSSLFAIRLVSSACLRLLISPSNLDSSLCFIQPGISHDVICK